MKAIFSFIFFALSTSVSAQDSINVYWTTDTGFKENDVIYYNSKVPLQWSDFTGAQKKTGDKIATTTSVFGFKTSTSVNGNKTILNIGVYCYFSKLDSWVGTKGQGDIVLKHEQRHFDITYINARIFIERLKLEKITLENGSVIIQKLFDECNLALAEMQGNYDNATRNGTEVKLQDWWDSKILGLLK